MSAAAEEGAHGGLLLPMLARTSGALYAKDVALLGSVATAPAWYSTGHPDKQGATTQCNMCKMNKDG
jgi:hypothetical protein